MTLEQSVVGSHCVLRYSKSDCRLVLMKVSPKEMPQIEPGENGRIVVGVKHVDDVEAGAKLGSYSVMAPTSQVPIPDGDGSLDVCMLSDVDNRAVAFVSVPSYYEVAQINPGARKQLLNSIAQEVMEAISLHY